jgi:hypothetical protein
MTTLYETGLTEWRVLMNGTVEYYNRPGKFYRDGDTDVPRGIRACDGTIVAERKVVDGVPQKQKPLLVDIDISNIHELKKTYKKNAGDIKKTYVGVGDDGYIVQKKRFDHYGNDLWEARKFTKGVKMEDCSVDLIYYTNSGLPYNRIVYINPNNKSLVKKYIGTDSIINKQIMDKYPGAMEAIKIISDWFLECKYNPKYNYCRVAQWRDLEDIYNN